MPPSLFVALALALPSADDFDRLDGPTLEGVPSRADVKAHDRLTIAEIGALPNVLRGVRSAPIVVKTDQGNFARLLATPALRKPAKEDDPPLPILVLERFATFEAPRATTRLARGQELILFDGFQIDLDTGQVVPERQGGDLQFLAKVEGGPRLVALGGAKIYTLDKSPLSDSPRPGQPSPGKTVLPTDFAGRYRLFANGQWSGVLDLAVADKGAISGTFRSDETGTSYRVTGQVAADAPQKVFFEAQMPRVRLAFTGYLWTEGKSAMAGTVSLLDREYGFFAIREGSRPGSDERDAGAQHGGPRKESDK